MIPPSISLPPSRQRLADCGVAGTRGPRAKSHEERLQIYLADLADRRARTAATPKRCVICGVEYVARFKQTCSPVCREEKARQSAARRLEQHRAKQRQKYRIRRAALRAIHELGIEI